MCAYGRFLLSFSVVTGGFGVLGSLAFLALAVVPRAQAQMESYACGASQDFHTKHYREGIDKLTAALATHPPAKVAAEIYEFRGRDYSEMHDYERALADFKEALGLDATIEYGHWNCAWLNSKMEHFAAAVSDYTLALEEKGANPWNVYEGRGRAYAKLGKVDPRAARF